jgi:hypothetical protein
MSIHEAVVRLHDMANGFMYYIHSVEREGERERGRGERD